MTDAIPTSNSRFLDAEEMKKLTGRPQKSKQIEWLRKEGLAFRVSATGHPVVTWYAVEGRTQDHVEAAPAGPPKWTPRFMLESK